MSSINDNINTTEPTSITEPTTTTTTRPEHHVHRADEPLPGARGGAPAADYSPENMERLPSKVWADETHAVPTRELNEDPFHTSSHHHEHGHGHEHGVGEGIEKRSQPMQPVHDSTTADTAVADDDRNPTRKATAADKLIGKAQAVVGKVAHKPEMQEKGELRQTEGKPSV